MARTGYKKAMYNVIGESGFAGTAKEFIAVVDEKLSVEYNNAELYGNDVLQESDYSFKSGTLSITVCDDTDTIIGELLGATAGSPATAEYTRNIADSAPYVAYGHIVEKKIGGVRKWKVECLPRVQFTSATTDSQTRGDSPEFKTTSLEAKVYACPTALGKFKVGDWEKHQTFDTLEAANTYLASLLSAE